MNVLVDLVKHKVFSIKDKQAMGLFKAPMAIGGRLTLFRLGYSLYENLFKSLTVTLGNGFARLEYAYETHQ